MVKIVLTLVLLNFGFLLNAQIQFIKIYSDVGFEKGEGITQLSDSSYLVTGSSTSFGDGPPQAFLMKLDSLGNHLWAKHYGGIEVNEGKRVFAIENYGYFVGGNTNSNVSADFNFYFVKTDMNGDPLFEKQVGTPAWDFVNDGIMLADSTFILTGETYNTPDGKEDAYTVRFKKNGDTLWTSQSHKPGIDKIYAAGNVGDTAFVLAGTVWNVDSSMQKAFVGCYYLDNRLIWEFEYGQINDYVIKDIEIYNNRIYAVGYRVNPLDGEKDEYTLQIHASNGGMVSTYSYYGNSDKSMEKIAKYGSDINFYIGYSFIDQFSLGTGADFSIRKFDDFFSDLVMWFQFLAIGQDDIGELISTNDGGAILIGTNRSFGTENANVLAIKIGPNDLYPNTTGTPFINSLVEVSEIKNGNSVLIYPNPFEDIVNFNFNDKVQGAIIIFSILGTEVYSKSIYSNSIALDLSELSSGTYFIQFRNKNKKSILGKIVK